MAAAANAVQIFVGDLGPEVTDAMLCQAFGYYPSLAGWLPEEQEKTEGRQNEQQENQQIKRKEANFC